YQFEVGMYYGDFWDPTNDWSYDGLKIGTSNDFYAVENPPEELAPHICLYDGDGVLIGGIEPDGTTPEADKPAETTTAPVTTTTSAGKTMLGDANEDTKVNMADAVAVLQNLANSTKYPLTAQGEINADCDGDSGLTGTDAIVILRVEAGELKQTDLPTK
ncbi:MAG: dockerin type I repeat-containing protein, partial [Oscillospiraceae bacterium]|nr:dockerin type I repeat-containing protein [Oscillospiraceae bacterium]